jgi:hypothetical protein
MIKILGLLIFFGLTGLILWTFNEMLWRVDDEDESDPHPLGGLENQESVQGYGETIESNSAPRTAQ